ncbi:gustatory receptor 46 [Tribolium castaneum]|uniref:Gustatory receptor n=1 Tax=Tribolium castaneum TaxID=7070 RepID=D2A4H9_TRICA|nr:gustatory receptor 46 [Tribolium castaneum]
MPVRKMDLQVVDLIFKVGKIFTITPSSLLQTSPNKIHSCFIVVTYIVVTSLTYKISHVTYKQLTSVQYILAIFSLVAVYTHDFYVFIFVRCWRNFWLDLSRGLRKVNNRKNRRKVHYFWFIMSQLFLLVECVFGLVYYTYFTNYQLAFLMFVNFFRRYFQMFFLILRCILLDIILGKYRQQLWTLESKVPQTRKVGRDLYVLKKTIDVFNDIFGWPCFTNIFSASITVLITLDVFIKSNGHFTYDTRTMTEVLNQMLHMIGICSYWICITINILLCDAVLKEFDKIEELVSELKLRKNRFGHKFILLNRIILHNRPEFKAADFFSLHKSTLFGITYSITNFLLIMIQFKPS